MFALFKALLERLKALVLTDAALDLEAHALVRMAERKAGLLRQAATFEAEGLSKIAAELRQQAEALDLTRPLASVLPVLEHLEKEDPTRVPLPNGAGQDSSSHGSLPQLPEPASIPSSSRRSDRKSR